MIVEQLKNLVDSLREDGKFERSDFATLCQIGVIVLNEIEPLVKNPLWRWAVSAVRDLLVTLSSRWVANV